MKRSETDHRSSNRSAGRYAWLRHSALCLVAGAGLLLTNSASAESGEYKPDEAGHPLRILAYVVHPVGVTFDYLILRPAFWVGSHDPFKTLFGRTD
jgi:hypothetical protein